MVINSPIVVHSIESLMTLMVFAVIAVSIPSLIQQWLLIVPAFVNYNSDFMKL